MTDETVKRLMALFEGSKTASGTHGEPDKPEPRSLKHSIKGTAKTLKLPPTLALWKQHVDGKRPLGIIPIREDGSAGWGSIDIDQYDINLLDVVKRVEQDKLPLVPCRSKSGGLHLFLFASQPVAAATMQAALGGVAAALGFAGSEIFPKQTTHDAGRGDMGNWMIMPYFGSDFGKKLLMQHGLKKTGAEQTIEEFVSFAEKRRITPDKFAVLQALRPLPPPPKLAAPRNATIPEPIEAFGDGPPCLEVMASGDGFPEGGRNNALFHIGVYLRKAHPNDWEEKLRDDNRQYMRPPLGLKEVDSVIASLDGKKYHYKCKDQPMVGHCDANLCRTRLYGVGDLPRVASIQVVTLDNPVWRVTVEGSNKHMELTDIRDLTNFNKFNDQCAAQLRRVFDIVPQAQWLAIIRDPLARAEEIQPDDDTSREEIFLDHLEVFLTNRTRGNKRSDLLRGAPFHDDDHHRYEFRMKDLRKHVEREGMKLTPYDMGKLLKELGGKSTTVKISATALKVWWVPSDKITAASELAAPDMPPEAI